MRIGVDLGGTKIEAIALDPAGATLARRRIPAPRDDYGATLGAITGLIAAIESETGQRGHIGIGTPGAISPFSGRLRNANSIWLNDQPLQHDLTQLLGRPVRLANDADCFALSEATDGAGRGAGSVFGVIIGTGTGTGGGVVIGGRLLTGPNAIAGEWGHNPLPWPTPEELPGPPCYCGKRGCLETYLSGPRLAADHHQHTGADLSPLAIAAAATRGDPAAQATLNRHAERLARGLASVINVLDPEVIVLGGGLSNLPHLYQQLPGLIRPHLFCDGFATRILPPVHGDSSGVRGAAWLWGGESP
ncbi:ROK family protein [uncultured Thiodictyon sp.]|uniref:ROK family protein n=1 Tax=uncultured Thiodictyon sp. TaxID=1846217 RepID=UPI0025D1B9DA|nr:ROK family protein [uncultured Thiodictyon sp.]